MKCVTAAWAICLLAGSAASACAAADLPDTATGAMATQPRRSNWNVPYHLKSRRDLTGLWEQKEGAGSPPGTQVMPSVCRENNRNPLGPDGKTTTILKGGQ